MIHYLSSNGVGNAWVGNELRVLAREGIPFVLHALRSPPSTFFGSEDVLRIHQGTRVVYPLPIASSLRSFLWAPWRFREKFLAAAWNALTGERESVRTRLAGIWHFYTACHWAEKQREQPPRLIHSQWIHSGGTVAMYGAWLLGVPFSFTGHAADLYRERAALLDKIRRAKLIICISTFHRDFFLKHGARPEQLRIAYCGIDTSHFAPKGVASDSTARFRILSSGRLVEKKGFAWLIQACQILKRRGVDFECVIAGSGPLENELVEQIRQADLTGIVEVTGRPLKQEDIPKFMHQGDVYCLPCVWAADGDVDGLPQMLMEAMACGLPAVSTRLVGIPDLIVHEQTGLLVDPEQAEPLADALLRLKEDRELSERLAAAGRRQVLEKFDLTTCLKPLLEAFKTHLEAK